MTTDEYDEGEVHGLLATAFDGDVPLVNVLPAAVAGYLRHRRRTRVLGTAGGALGLVGVVVGGTALAAGNSSPDRSQSAAADPGSTAVVDVTTACDGEYHLFGQYNGSGVYSADQKGLRANCQHDLTALRALTGDPTLEPLTENSRQAITKHDLPAGSTSPSAGDYIQPGYYDGRINGTAYRISIFVSDKTDMFGNNCTPQACPPNRMLADGRGVTELSGGSYSSLVVHYDATHSVMVNAFLTERTKAKTVPFDVEKLIASPGFAALISAHVQTLDQLTHPA